MPHAVLISPDDFYATWTHSLAEDFQRDGAPAMSGAWVADVARIGQETTPVSAPAISHDNALIAAGVGRDVHVYDAATAQLLHAFRGHTSQIHALEFHPTLRKLVSSSQPSGMPTARGYSRERLVRVWDLDAPERDPDEVYAVAGAASTAAAPLLLRHWSPEDLESAGLQTEIAAMILEAQTRIDVRSGRAFIGSLPGCGSRAFSRDGRALLFLPLTDGLNVDIAVLDVETLTERLRHSGHTSTIVWAETSPDDKVVATSSMDKTVRVWSLESGESLHVLTGAAGASRGGAFSPDGEFVAAGSDDKIVRIWNVRTGELVRAVPDMSCDHGAQSLSFSPDGRFLATGARGGALRVFDVASGASVQRWQIDMAATEDRHADMFLQVSCVRYTPRGDLFFTSTDGRIFGYRAAQNLKWEFFEFGSRNCRDATPSVDGSRLIAALGTSVGVWKIE